MNVDERLADLQTGIAAALADGDLASVADQRDEYWKIVGRYYPEQLAEHFADDVPVDEPYLNGNGAEPEPDYYRSWNDVDLGPALRGEKVAPVPSIGKRDDGRHLLYRGQMNGIHGDSGCGKSMFAAAVAAQEIRAGNDVVWLDFEDPNETPIVNRFLDMALTPEQIARRLHYKAPQVPADREAVDRLNEQCASYRPSLIVLDSIGEAFSLEALDENKDLDVAGWHRRTRPMLSIGAALLTIDHGTKAADNPLHASGSKRKRAGITGASYLAEVAVPFSREQEGTIRLTCAKDRHGHWARGEVVALVNVAPDPDEGIGIEITNPPTARDVDPSTEVLAAALDALDVLRGKDDPLTLQELAEHMPKRRAAVKRAGVKAAIRVGAIAMEVGAKNSQLHRYERDLTNTDKSRISTREEDQE